MAFWGVAAIFYAIMAVVSFVGNETLYGIADAMVSVACVLFLVKAKRERE
ncbi:hypothetical protein WD019_02305 [Fictibacillus sp. Mic-4]